MKEIISFGFLFIASFTLFIAFSSFDSYASAPVFTVDVSIRSTFEDYNSDIVADQTGLAYGSTVTVEVAHANYTFAFWIVNGIMRSELTAEDNTFVATSNLDIVAVFHPTDGEYAVLFIDTNGKVIETKYVVSGAVAEPVELPSKIGYVLATGEDRWISLIGSATLGNIETNTVFQLQYVYASTETVEISVAGGTGTGNYNFNQVVTVTATDSENFTHWEEDGVIVSYDQNYTFTAVYPRALEAKTEGTVEPLITISENLAIREGFQSYIGQLHIPSSYEILEYGYLITDEIETSLDFSNAKHVVYGKEMNAHFEFLTSFPSTYVRTIKAYAVIRNVDNHEIDTLYSIEKYRQVVFNNLEATLVGISTDAGAAVELHLTADINKSYNFEPTIQLELYIENGDVINVIHTIENTSSMPNAVSFTDVLNSENYVEDEWTKFRIKVIFDGFTEYILLGEEVNTDHFLESQFLSDIVRGEFYIGTAWGTFFSTYQSAVDLRERVDIEYEGEPVGANVYISVEGDKVYLNIDGRVNNAASYITLVYLSISGIEEDILNLSDYGDQAVYVFKVDITDLAANGDWRDIHLHIEYDFYGTLFTTHRDFHATWSDRDDLNALSQQEIGSIVYAFNEWNSQLKLHIYTQTEDPE